MPTVGVNPGYSYKDYPGNLTPCVSITCIVAAMGGLIFGYEIGISGRVESTGPFLEKFFPAVLQKSNDQKSTNQYCTYDNQTLTMFISSQYLVALFASLIASMVTQKFGRRLCMLFGGVLFCAGAITNGFANAVRMLIIGRILLGFGIGFTIQSVPLYLSEMAPHKFRGALNIGFQLSITVGIFISNIFSYFFAKMSGDWGWRLSLGGAVVPGIIVTVGSFFLPDTPNTLIVGGLLDKARAQLRRIRGVEDVDEEFNDLVAAAEVSKLVEHPWTNLLERKYRPQLTMAVLIPFFQQLTGIRAIVFYASVLFNRINFGSDASLMSVVISFSANVPATLISIYGVDKWGRRWLFLEGGVQMFICLCVVAAAIGVEFGVYGDHEVLPKWYAIVLLLFIYIYVSAFAWSWGPLGWLVPSEIFPLEIRSVAQSINVSINMISTFVVAQVFLTMLCHLKFGLFLLFAFFVLVMSIFVFFFLPETKDIPIEEMTTVWKSHWYWSRFVNHDDMIEFHHLGILN